MATRPAGSIDDPREKGSLKLNHANVRACTANMLRTITLARDRHFHLGNAALHHIWGKREENAREMWVGGSGQSGGFKCCPSPLAGEGGAKRRERGGAERRAASVEGSAFCNPRAPAPDPSLAMRAFPSPARGEGWHHACTAHGFTAMAKSAMRETGWS